MSNFPEIKGITWLSEGFPDLISIKVKLVSRSLQELEIPGMDLPEIDSELHVDLSRLAGVGPWYPKGAEEPSETECSVDIDGMSNFVADVSVKDLLEAWLFYKNFIYSKKI